jgi:hypothetical protein
MSRPIFLAFLLPGVALGLAYWIGVGWLGDTYDISLAGRVVVTGIYALVFVGLWSLLAAVGAALVARLRR